MYASLIVVGGLGAFATQSWAAGGVDTVIDTTVITITSCGPEVESCPGKTEAPTTSEVTETSTYCPPTVATTAPAVVVPESSATAPIVPPVTPAYVAPTGNASSVIIQVSELSSASPTTAAPIAPATTPASNLSVIVNQPSGTEASAVATSTEIPTGASSAPAYANSTLTAPTLPGNETGILTAIGKPSTLTSVIVVPASSAPPESGSSTSSTTPKATGGTGRLVVPGIMLGLLVVGAALLG